jgi:hypothetical protein
MRCGIARGVAAPAQLAPQSLPCHPAATAASGKTIGAFIDKAGPCYRGKKKDHTVNNVLLVNALLFILFLSDTYGGRTHDKPIADTTPSPLLAGSRL